MSLGEQKYPGTVEIVIHIKISTPPHTKVKKGNQTYKPGYSEEPMTPALQYLIFCAGVGMYNFKRSWFIKLVVRSLPVNGIRDNECALV